MWNLIQHWTGIDNTGGRIYAWWSGFGSDIGELTIVAAIIGAARAHNCHVKGCWRLGNHPVVHTPYKCCKKHHPRIDHTRRVTAETVRIARDKVREPIE